MIQSRTRGVLSTSIFSHPTFASPTADGQSRSEMMPIWPDPSALASPATAPSSEGENARGLAHLGIMGVGTVCQVIRMAQASGRHRNGHTGKLRRNSADARTLAKMGDRSKVRLYSSRLLHKMMRPPHLAASGRSGTGTSVIEPPLVPLYSSPIPACRRP